MIVFEKAEFGALVQNTEPVFMSNGYIGNNNLQGAKDKPLKWPVTKEVLDMKEAKELLNIDGYSKIAMIRDHHDVINYHEAFCRLKKNKAILKNMNEEFKETPEQLKAREAKNKKTLDEIKKRVERKKYDKLTNELPGFSNKATYLR